MSAKGVTVREGTTLVYVVVVPSAVMGYNMACKSWCVPLYGIRMLFPYMRVHVLFSSCWICLESTC
jgi:hypothetical protein